MATASTAALKKKLSTLCTITCQRISDVVMVTSETANDVPKVNAK